MTPTPTPRTDAEWQSVTVSAPWDAAAEHMAQVARKLERELAAITCEEGELWELRQANARMRDNLASLSKLHAAEMTKAQKSFERELAAKDAHADEIYKAGVDLAAMLEDKLAAERALADRLAGCIERMPWIYGIREKEEAGEALAAWKGARKS